jgi:hypothetical protein
MEPGPVTNLGPTSHSESYKYMNIFNKYLKGRIVYNLLKENLNYVIETIYSVLHII